MGADDDDESKKQYDVPLIRLRNSQTELDTDDLDEEERKALAEVSKKGYYHARPKTEEAPPPPRIESAEAVQWEVKPTSTSTFRKRTQFDSFQKKWDKFEKEEPVVRIVEESKPKPEAKQSEAWNPLSCCRRRK
eukprot:gb/GFBE01041346.1/.p1 GENE.gb/GFBE01041346.1/~~gb/GFBE01041346.1/.p1  ORF type:complete len:134 (+),score=38.91 gb/GFBE01041346.1/:1-402(+)